jgi:hypothetical protein
MKTYTFWGGGRRIARLKSTDVSEENVALISSVQKHAK